MPRAAFPETNRASCSWDLCGSFSGWMPLKVRSSPHQLHFGVSQSQKCRFPGPTPDLWSGVRSLYSKMPSMCFWCSLQFENHYFRNSTQIGISQTMFHRTWVSWDPMVVWGVLWQNQVRWEKLPLHTPLEGVVCQYVSRTYPTQQVPNTLHYEDFFGRESCWVFKGTLFQAAVTPGQLKYTLHSLQKLGWVTAYLWCC